MPRPQLPAIIALLGLLVAAPSASALGEQPAHAAPTTAPTVFARDRVIVQWAPSADHSDKVEARDEADVTFNSDLGNRDFQLVKVEPDQTAGEAVAELEADPAVVAAGRDGYSSLDSIPNDPFFNQLWGLENAGLGVNGFSGALAGADINAADAWNRTAGSPTIVIADLDSGYRFNHPDLGPVAWTNPTEVANGADDDGNGIKDDLHGADFVGTNANEPQKDGDPSDDDLLAGGHGVHTAGTIGAAGNNSTGITGVARNARIMPLRVCGYFPSTKDSRCPFSAQIAAINYAGNKGARVANMSLGGNSKEPLVLNAIAANSNVLFVISAGNDGGNNDGGEAAPKGHHYPCDYQPTVEAPGAGVVDNIICVAATDQADQLAGFSDYGAISVDLGAPGTETLSAFPTSIRFQDSFEAADFGSRWSATGANGGFARTNEAPLTSFGITDSPGASAPTNTTRESTSAAVTLPPGLGSCVLSQRRFLSVGTGNAYSYSVLLNGSSVFSSGSVSASGVISTVPIPELNAGGEVQVVERYATGATSPLPTNGAWIDDIKLTCFEPVASTAPTYAFLQGTSMAAPHVSGAAGLLFSLKPTASVTEVRNALLSSVDPVASLSGKTTTGGRLDVAAALKALVPIGSETVAPDTAITSAPAGSSQNTQASFQFIRTDADAGAFECKLDAGAFASCTSPASFSVGVGSHTFQVRAKVPSGIVDPSPASATWTVVAPPVVIASPPANPTPTPVPTCVVPKLAGLTQAAAVAALNKAHCKLGKVTKPKAKKGQRLPRLVVKSSSPVAGAKTSGPVNLTLGPKPKKHHR